MCPPPKRHAVERENAAPGARRLSPHERSAEAFQRDDVRDKVIPAYMGLIKQCDDQLGGCSTTSKRPAGWRTR